MTINDTKDKKQRLILIYSLAVFLAALLLRVLWMLTIRTEQKFDFATYQVLAENIANRLGHTLNGVPVAWQGSAYPYLLGLFYRMIGSTDEIYGKILNIILSMGTLAICWFLYGKMFRNIYQSLAAFTLTAFLPQYVAYVSVLGTEIFHLFLLAGILCLQLYFPDKKQIYVVIGVLTGIAALTKPFMLAYPVICGGIRWTTGKRLKETLLLTGIALCAMIVTIAPWTYRNYRCYGRFIPISYNAGYVLYTNNNDMNFNGAWMDLQKAASTDPESLETINRILENGSRSVKEAYDIEPFLKEKSRRWMLQNPIEFFKLGCLRVKQTFFVGVNDIEQWAMNGHGYPQEGPVTGKVRIQRNYLFMTGLFDVITYVINGAGFIFCLAVFFKFLKAFFSGTYTVDMLTAVMVINLAFFIFVSFVYGGEARYAFPVFLFMIPGFVALLCGTMQNYHA